MIRNENYEDKKHETDESTNSFDSHKENSNLRQVSLWGAHGSGKTVLGVEIAKMFMAKLRKEQCEGEKNKNFDLYVIDFNDDGYRTAGKSTLLNQLEKMFENEDGCDKKSFWTAKDLESETGIYVDDEDEDFLSYSIQHISSETKEKCSVIFIDEINAGRFEYNSNHSHRKASIASSSKDNEGELEADFLKSFTSNRDENDDADDSEDVDSNPSTDSSFSSDESVDDEEEDVIFIDFSKQNHYQNKNIFIITCVNPVVNDKPNKTYKAVQFDEQRLLEEKGILVKQLKTSYRNCKEIQQFYNVFKNHYDVLRRDSNDYKDHVITGEMQQPSSTTSSENKEKIDNLPSGQMPILIQKLSSLIPTYKKKEDMKNEETIKNNIMELVDITEEDMNMSVLCYKRNEDCSLCQQINIELQKQNVIPKMRTMRDDDGDLRSSGFSGCEDDVLFIHFPAVNYYNKLSFEMFSRARRKLLLLMDDSFDFESNKDLTFYKTLAELIEHEENCNNKSCKKQGLSKEKVIEFYDFSL